MFGIETQGGESGGRKAGLLLNITEREREKERQETQGRRRRTGTHISERFTHCLTCLSVFFSFL